MTDKDSSIGASKLPDYAPTGIFSLGTINVELSAANKMPEISSEVVFRSKTKGIVVTLDLSPDAIRLLGAWIAFQLLPIATPSPASTSGTIET